MAERYDVNIPVEQTTQRLNNIAAGYASLIGVARKHGFPLQASTLEDYFPSRDHYRAFMEDYKQRGVNPYAVPGLVRPMTSPVINNSLTQQSQGTTVQPSAGATAGPVPTYKPVMISPQIGGMQ
jgi:hypothetical protein